MGVAAPIWRPWPNTVRPRKIQFSCTPFYLEAVAELAPFVDFYKIASYELLVGDLLKACAATGKPVVLSTGMATMDEIVSAARTLKRGGAQDVTLLHCVSAYPTPPAKPISPPSPPSATPPAFTPAGPITPARPAVIERAVHRWGARRWNSISIWMARARNMPPAIAGCRMKSRR